MKTSTKIFITLLIVLISKNISAQVIITSDLNPVIDTIPTYEYVTINSRSTSFYNELQWNFDVSDSAQKTFEYTSALDTPFEDSAATTDANIALIVGSGKTYYSNDADAWRITAYASKDFFIKYNHSLVLFNYPLELGDVFSDSATSVYLNAGLETHRNALITSVVDSAGLLFLSNGDNSLSGNCIKIHVVEKYTDDVYVNGIFNRQYITIIDSDYWLMEDPMVQGLVLQSMKFTDVSKPSNNRTRSFTRQILE